MGMLLQLCALVALPVAAPLLQPTARRAPRLTRLRAVGNEALSAKSWEAVGASAEMVGAAVACGAGDGPTKIQAMCYAAVANNKDCLIADQTGSGKTLAYLLPVVEKLRAEEKENNEPRKNADGACAPRAVVLAPTAELAAQVFGVARAVSASGAAVRVRCATSEGFDARDAARALKRGGGACDILIATPGRLAKLLDTGAVSLARAGDVVLDEVDVLALADDGAALKPILSADGVGAEARFVFVTATLPKRVEKQLRDEFEGLETFKGPGLHRAPLGLSVALVDCSAPREPARAGSSSGRRRPADDDLLDLDAIFEEDVAEGKPARKPSRDKKGRNRPKAAPTRQEAAATKKVDAVFERKKAALLESLTLGRAPVDGSAATAGLGAAARSLVFCNTIESCRRVENALKRADRRGRDRSLLAYHSALPADARRRNLGTFAAASSRKPAVLVCTDRASRGVDFDEPVDLVVLFDWPRDPNEFLRRVGRTARCGRKGHATILAAGAYLPLAREVKAACDDGRPVDSAGGDSDVF